MQISQISVIGAGTMGTSVALVFAQHRYVIDLIDISTTKLDQATDILHYALRTARFFSKNKELENDDTILSRINLTTDLDAIKNSDYVIENVTEKWDIRKELYPQLDTICSKQVIFAVNTSTMPISKIAALTKRPQQVIGMHFMNPVYLKPVVEVIKTALTSNNTIKTSTDLLASINKEGVIVNDAPGFVTNRVLMLMINEAIWLLHNQTATAQDIDKIFRTCFGHKMGPLETGDLIGLDTILYSLESLQEELQDEKFKPCPLLIEMVTAKHYGKKSGQGFYHYHTTEIVAE